MEKKTIKLSIWIFVLMVVMIQFLFHPTRLFFQYLLMLCIFWVAIFGATDIITIFLNFLNYQEKDEGIENAGAWIGILERLLMLIFLLSGFYSGIPTVLVIKGFARYKKIAEDSKFAERFTIGTMLSMLIIVISTMMLHKLLITNDFHFFEYLLPIKIS